MCDLQMDNLRAALSAARAEARAAEEEKSLAHEQVLSLIRECNRLEEKVKEKKLLLRFIPSFENRVNMGIHPYVYRWEKGSGNNCLHDPPFIRFSPPAPSADRGDDQAEDQAGGGTVKPQEGAGDLKEHPRSDEGP